MRSLNCWFRTRCSLRCVVVTVQLLALPAAHAEEPAAEAGSQANAAFWATIEQSSVKRTSPDPSDPAVTEAMLAAQDHYSQGRYAEAEAGFMALLQRPEFDARTEAIVRQWLALALMNQTLPPSDRIEAFMTSLDSVGPGTPALWSAALRLLFRQISAAPTEEKLAVWQRGLDRLRLHFDDLRLDPSALTDLDRFLAMSDQDRGMPAVQVIEELIVLTPSVETLVELNRCRRDRMVESGAYTDALSAAWLQVALASTSADMATALDAYRETLRSSGAPLIDERDLLRAPRHLGGFIVNRTSSSLAPQSGDSLRRRAWLAALSGNGDTATTHARQAVWAAPLGQVAARLGDASAIAVITTGKLGAMNSLLCWHGQRLDLLKASTRGESADSSSSLAPVSNGAFGAASRFVQRDVVSRELRSRSARCQDWAKHALQTDRDALAAMLWAEALQLWPGVGETEAGADSVDRMRDSLRALSDKSRAAEITRNVRASLSDTTLAGRVAFVEATLRYEAGQMQESLAVLREVEQALAAVWDDEECLAAGLMRSVALIKVQQLGDAKRVLQDLELLNGETEQMAQVAFLQGWICLNRNQTDEALNLFRRIMDRYPGSSYAVSIRELIPRLETADSAK